MTQVADPANPIDPIDRSLFDPAVQEQMALFAKAGLPAEAILQKKVQAQAMILSFGTGFQLTMAAILVGIILVMFLKKPAAVAGGEPLGAH